MNKKTYYNYPLSDYQTFNGSTINISHEPNKLLSTKGNTISVQPLWRMEQLAKYYRVDIHQHHDTTNYEYYNEVLCQKQTQEERDKFRQENLHRDTYETYYEEVAAVAAEIGCERAEIKCLIKSLMLKYRIYKIGNINDFPHKEFNALYNRLTKSNDTEQIRVAERLSRHYIEQIEMFVWYDIESKKMSAR